MEKWLVQIEFRYTDASDMDYDNGYRHVNDKVTLGIFDTFEDACACGNAALENDLETRFELNKNYNRKDRFGKGNGPYGSDTTLISDMAYLTTPFSFFAKITKLKYGNIGEAINNAVEGPKRAKINRDRLEQ